MKAQLERDQQRLEANLKAQASRAQIAADNTAIANDRLAAQASGSTLDT
ncbi:hypothetical protein [Pengzhenrongella phosphoraccumulans]